MANIWGPVTFRRSFKELSRVSTEKARLVLSFYSKNHSGKIFILFLLIAGVMVFIRNLKKKIREAQAPGSEDPAHLVMRHPLLSSLLIVPSVFQFIFPTPPFIFSVILWIISVAALTFIFRNFITKYWMMAWLIMVGMFLLAAADNLILQASRIERWGMLFLSLAGIISGAAFLLSGRRKELKERGIQIFITFLVLMEIIAVIANLYGRFNISKSFLTSGFFGLINGILFFWVIRLIIEALTIAAQIFKTPGRNTLYINFEKVEKKVPPVFYYLMVIGWCILFGRNFYFFRKLTEPFSDFMVKERAIGQYNFTLQSIFIFFLILVLSGVISSIVTFFASGNPAGETSRDRKGGIGSWLLLIRIAIISIGVLLAFAAAGIPMDRLAIILGALSVGIGFGLQSLVNNLVSGLILAFEKPINVGDVVEFGDQAGTMKSIGFRSSVITTWNGADVIIPNGNLLNQHLINWTRSNSSRRVEILVGVAFGTDLEKTKKLLLDLLNNESRIMKYPQPLVLIKDFNASSIDMRVLFWVEHYDTWTAIKSDMISVIDSAFKKEGIKIPFPQQEIQIRNFAGEPGKKE
jgi:small-conductance mechanosensitive channel